MFYMYILPELKHFSLCINIAEIKFLHNTVLEIMSSDKYIVYRYMKYMIILVILFLYKTNYITAIKRSVFCFEENE